MVVQGGAGQTKRADVDSPQAHSGRLETNPERVREKPRRASHVAAPQVQREWLLRNVHFSKERALRQPELLTPQGEALPEDLDPSC